MNLTDLYNDVKFKAAADTLSFPDFVRMANQSVKQYSYIRLSANGRWQWDDSTHVDDLGRATLPVGYATLTAGTSSIPLDTDMVVIKKVAIDGQVIQPMYSQDYTFLTANQVYSVGGRPRYYDYSGGSMNFYSKADRDYTVTVWYSRTSPDFDVNAVDAPLGIPSIHFRYLSLDIRSQLAERSNDENANNIEQKLQIEEQRIRDFASKEDQDRPRGIRSTIDVPR